LKGPPSILFRSEFNPIVRVPPVFSGEAEVKEGMKMTAAVLYPYNVR
jgi:hypothetical protein